MSVMYGGARPWTIFVHHRNRMDGRMDGWMDGWTDGRTDGRTDGWMDGWMDGRTDGWMDGWMDGWIGNIYLIYIFLRVHSKPFQLFQHSNYTYKVLNKLASDPNIGGSL